VAELMDMKTWTDHLGHSRLRSFTDKEGHFWLAQNAAKRSKWGKLAREGHDVAWEFVGPSGAYTGRMLIDGEIHTIRCFSRNSNWLPATRTGAKNEIGIFSRHCLGNRTIPDLETLRKEAKAWNRRMNRDRVKIAVEIRSKNCSPKVRLQKEVLHAVKGLVDRSFDCLRLLRTKCPALSRVGFPSRSSRPCNFGRASASVLAVVSKSMGSRNLRVGTAMSPFRPV